MKSRQKICGFVIAALATAGAAMAADHPTGSPNQRIAVHAV
jgi:hypothetical protein